MPYIPTQAPPNLRDHDELRKWVEEEFRRLAQAWTDTETRLIAGNTEAIAKLTNNQFARVYLSTTQAGIPLSASTTVNFDAVSWDWSSIWNSAGKYFKPTVAGHYRISWAVYMQWGGASAQALSMTYKSGVIQAYGINLHPVGTYLGSGGSDMVYLNGTTDNISVAAYMSGGASRDVIGGSHLTYFAIDLVKAD